jgi:hypothetical protein
MKHRACQWRIVHSIALRYTTVAYYPREAKF